MIEGKNSPVHARGVCDPRGGWEPDPGGVEQGGVMAEYGRGSPLYQHATFWAQRNHVSNERHDVLQFVFDQDEPRWSDPFQRVEELLSAARVKMRGGFVEQEHWGGHS